MPNKISYISTRRMLGMVTSEGLQWQPLYTGFLKVQNSNQGIGNINLTTPVVPLFVHMNGIVRQQVVITVLPVKDYHQWA